MCAMKRYFFDVVSHGHSEYDYRGREFPTPEKAIQLAELIAIDLEVCPKGAFVGSSVNVHDTHGRQFYSMRVRPPEFAAA
jgi:hypothetical protein